MRENRLENTLAYMAAGVVAVSVLDLMLLMAANLFKFTVPAFLVFLPGAGLPLGFILVIALLIVSVRRKSRENNK